MRSAGCTKVCLHYAGQAGLPMSGPIIHAARLMRTAWYFDDRTAFMRALVNDINRARKYADKKGMKLAIRPNATSDIPWHRVKFIGYNNIMEIFPDVQFYDYTKVAKRLLNETLPANYHLTFSLSETNESEAVLVLAAMHNVAIVYRNRAQVESLLRYGKYCMNHPDGRVISAPVVDGDANDLRFIDPPGSVTLLYAKGPAKHDQSGFVRDLNPLAA